jgi:hypothetical protein
MNNKIANLIKSYVDDLEWSDKIAGLVQTANIRVKNGEDVSDKSYPVSCDISADACIKGAYQDLAPDSKKKSVIYFEDKGVSFVEKIGNRLKFDSTLRLVCWLNHSLIQGGICDPDTIGCGSTGDYVIDVIKSLPTSPIQTDDFISIQITGISQAERDVSIFSKYSYNEVATQYLMFPFDYFALDLTISFVVPCVKAPYVVPDVQYNDWFLPSADLVSYMWENVKEFGVGGFANDYYQTSVELGAFQNWAVNFADGSGAAILKSVPARVRACRSFTTTDVYALRDQGPAGGLICLVIDNGSNFTYYESAPSDQSSAAQWSNVIDVAVGLVSPGQYSESESQNNTTAIINQVGHITSAAKLCDELIV